MKDWLSLDDEGRVRRWHDPGPGLDWVARELGAVESAEAPPELASELALLRADWADRPSRAELRAEARAAYLSGLR